MGVLTQVSVWMGRECPNKLICCHHNWDGRSKGRSSGSHLGLI